MNKLKTDYSDIKYNAFSEAKDLNEYNNKVKDDIPALDYIKSGVVSDDLYSKIYKYYEDELINDKDAVLKLLKQNYTLYGSTRLSCAIPIKISGIFNYIFPGIKLHSILNTISNDKEFKALIKKTYGRNFYLIRRNDMLLLCWYEN